MCDNNKMYVVCAQWWFLSKEKKAYIDVFIKLLKNVTLILTSLPSGFDAVSVFLTVRNILLYDYRNYCFSMTVRKQKRNSKAFSIPCIPDK